MENIPRTPFWGQLNHFSKFMMFIAVFLMCLSIFNLLAALVMIPFANIHSLSDINNMYDYSNPSVVLGLKFSQTVSAIGSFIIPAILFAYLVSGNSIQFLKINILPNPKTMLLVLLLVVAVLPVINWTVELNSKMVLPDFLSGVEQWMKTFEEQAKQLTEAFLKMSGITDLIVNLIIVALIAAVSEELLFRGVMQKLLIDWIKNVHVAIWITAIIFSAFHMQFYGFLPRMLLGAMLGYLFVWSGSIWVSIFAHFLNNAIGVTAEYLMSKQIIPVESDKLGEDLNPVMILLPVLATILILYFIYKEEKAQKILEIVPE